MNDHTLLPLVVLTAARDEESHIGLLLASMIAQRGRPLRWIIVDDGSSDRTSAIVRAHAEGHPWIELLSLPPRPGRNFAAKASNINLAYARTKHLAFDYVANIDADVSFSPDYLSFVVTKLRENHRLGIAGTPYVEAEGPAARHSLAHRNADFTHVSGPCQIFRRDCFEMIGGYQPIPGGAVDWVAVRTARLRGWETCSFPEHSYRHHRRMGTAERSPLQSAFHYGQKAYGVGSSPLWVCLKGITSLRHKPAVLGGLAYVLGFLVDYVRRRPKWVSAELQSFHRRDEWTRLRTMLRRPRPPATPQLNHT